MAYIVTAYIVMPCMRMAYIVKPEHGRGNRTAGHGEVRSSLHHISPQLDAKGPPPFAEHLAGTRSTTRRADERLAMVVWTRSLDLCLDMCLDMCLGMRSDVSSDMGSCRHVLRHEHCHVLQTCAQTAQTCVQMCVGVSRHVLIRCMWCTQGADEQHEVRVPGPPLPLHNDTDHSSAESGMMCTAGGEHAPASGTARPSKAGSRQRKSLATAPRPLMPGPCSVGCAKSKARL